ncbi:hypothetical protein [Psychrobacter sp. AOP3-A1-26]|uniref:hypothetical protein n=1 Tax=Psychrobacter sp. AOP3-A1-26 TaxID=3457700 RepID=UPI004036F7F3
MSDIEISATATVTNYPKGKVIGVYGLLGGAIGGLIVFLYMIVMFVIDGNIFSQELTDIFKMLLASIVGGFFFGLIPSLIAALITTKFKIYFDLKLEEIVSLFFIGLFSAFIYIVWFTVDKEFMDAVVGTILFCCVGGTSAVIIGWFALPKHK